MVLVQVTHCGHPTALWPWMLTIDGRPVLQPNGTAWQYKREAMRAGALIASGKLDVHRIRQKSATMARSVLVTCAGKSSRFEDILQAWQLIRP